MAHWSKFALYASSLAVLQSTVHAQSFDCQAASTPVEHAICAHQDLADLDRQLAGDLRGLLAARPADRKKTLTDERQWLRQRDESCALQAEAMAGCLSGQYNARIKTIEDSFRAPSSNSHPAICQAIVDRYRPLADPHPGEAPLSVLGTSPGLGVKMEPGSGEPLTTVPSDLVAWAARQKPAFVISRPLLDSLNDFESSGSGALLILMQVPGINFYSISRTEGSMGCTVSVSFVVQAGVAAPSSTPGDTAGEGDCDPAPVYGTIDQSVVAIVQEYDWRPGMSASLKVWSWNGSEFARACQVNLTYKPRFSAATLNGWGSSCDGKDCDRWRQVAFELASAAEEAPKGLKERTLKPLESGQRAKFERISQRIGEEVHEPESNDAFVIPYVEQGGIYFVRIGHFAIGWRDYADWSVTFFSSDDDTGKLVRRGSFAVGTKKGDLRDVSIRE